MAVVLLFAGARESAGVRQAEIDGATVGAVLEAAVERFGPPFADILPTCRVWVNGSPATEITPVGADDELAVLPPVSGGSTAW